MSENEKRDLVDDAHDRHQAEVRMDLTSKRTAFFIDESMWTPMGYIPCLVTEGETKMVPLSGDPEKHQSPWYWGTTLEVARFITAKANEDKGLTPEDVEAITAAARRAHAWGRHDEDGKPFISWFDREHTLGFIWDGDPFHNVQVTREVGEPVFATFPLPYDIVRTSGELPLTRTLKAFQRECERWVREHKGSEW